MSLTVLDFGAGTSKMKGLIELYMSWDVVAVDMSPRDKLVQYVNFSGDNIPFEDGSFDKIISLSTVQYITDLEALFKEFARMLNVGGEIFIVYPFKLNPYNFLYADVSKGWWYCDKPLKKAGFVFAKSLIGGGGYLYLRGVKR